MGDRVLALLPVPGNTHQAPNSLKRKNNLNYVTATPDRSKTKQLCHVNMLKPYNERKEVISDKYQQCTKWSKRVGDPKDEEWKASHHCKINHEGSANSMETVATRGLKYKHMLGDGDSSTYNAIVKSKPYGDECIPKKA